MSNTKFIILKDTVGNSILSNFFYFGTMFGGMYLNYAYMGQSTLINFTLIVLVFLAMLARTLNGPRLTADEAIEKIKAMQIEGKRFKV